LAGFSSAEAAPNFGADNTNLASYANSGKKIVHGVALPGSVLPRGRDPVVSLRSTHTHQVKEKMIFQKMGSPFKITF